jgi:hypothetical protein
MSHLWIFASQITLLPTTIITELLWGPETTNMKDAVGYTLRT